MIGLNNARFQWLDLWPFLHSHYRNFIGSTTAFQQQFICLFSSSDSFLRKLLPFLVPIILSLHIPLGLHYEPVSLPVPVTQHGRSEGKFLLNHTDCALTHPYISIWSSFRPVHSRIRQFTRRGKHSNHRYFVDSWPISSTICFQTAFGHHKWWLRLLSAVVAGLRTPAITADARPPRADVSGRYSFIPSVELSVIQATDNRYLSADFLPSTNESHFPRKGRCFLNVMVWCFESDSQSRSALRGHHAHTQTGCNRTMQRDL